MTELDMMEIKTVLKNCLHEFDAAHGLIVNDGQPTDKPETWSLDYKEITGKISSILEKYEDIEWNNIMGEVVMRAVKTAYTNINAK